MGNNIDILRSIAKGNNFYLKFEKTIVYKVQNGKEVLVDSFYHSKDDDFYATISHMPNLYPNESNSFSLIFNKFEKLQKLGIFQWKNNGFYVPFYPEDWNWHKVDGGFDLIEYPIYSDGFISVCVYTSASGLGMLIFVGNEQSLYYKIALTQPINI